MKIYKKKYSGIYSEAYINKRMIDYFNSFTIMSAEDMEIDMSTMERYARRHEFIAYIHATDFVKAGSNISIRTRKGILDCEVGEKTYFIIERDGTVHGMTEEKFEQCMYPVDVEIPENYCVGVEYVPTLKDWTDDKVYAFPKYAKMCMPREDFKVYATVLDKCVKLFPNWDADKYLLGMPGDYLVANVSDLSNMFIEPGDSFFERFEKI